MGEKSQSVISRLSGSLKIKAEYRKFKNACKFAPTLAEELFFKSCCAALIEEHGFVPPSYASDVAAYLRLYRDGKIPAGWPTEKAMEAH